MSEAVLAEADGSVLTITLNRPEASNAVNLAVAEGVAAALDRLDRDDALQVGILTGVGGAFCAGMDLKAFITGERPWVEGRGFAGIVEGPPRKPLIAAIEGFAVAGGFEVALARDLVVAARDARLGIPEVKRSLVAAGGALIDLPRRIPYHVAMELALTGDPIDAARATSSAWSTGWPSLAERCPPHGSWPPRSPPTDRWPSTPPRHPARVAGLDGGGAVGPAGRDRRPRLRLGRRPRRCDRVRREAAA